MAAFQKAIDAIDRTTSLSFTDSSQPIQVAVGDLSGVSISVSGTFTGSLAFEGSVSGTSWSAIDVYLLSDNSESATITSTGQYGINTTPFSQIKIIPTVSSGTAVVEMLAITGNLLIVGGGTKIDTATMPTGGVGLLGWVSSIYQFLVDRIPALVDGKIPVQVSSLNVTVGNASLEISNDVGNPIPVSGAVSLTSESGFLSVRNTALTNTASAIKTSPGSVMGWNFINVNPVTVYVKFYNLTTANTTVGTSTPILTIAIPGGSTSNPGIHFQEANIISQQVFDASISMACVTGLADNSNTAPTTAIHAEVRYK
jgi:hypothetical protein